MKKSLLLFSLAAVCSSAAISAEITDAALNSSFDAIKKANSPRYLVFHHDKIIAGMEAFIASNDLTYAQNVIAARRIAEHANALNDGAETFNKYFAVIDGCTNQSVRVSNLTSLIDAVTHRYSFNREAGWKVAMGIFDKDAASFNWEYRMRKRADLASIGVGLYFNRQDARYDELFNAVLAEACPEGTFHVTNRYNDVKTSTLITLVNGLLPINEDTAKAQFDKFCRDLPMKSRTWFLVELAKSYADHSNRPGFDAVLREVGELPLEDRIQPYCDILGKLAAFDLELAERLTDDELADKNLTPVQRQRYLALKQSFYKTPTFNYGFNTPGQYGKWRELTRERIALAEANADDPKARYFAQSHIARYEVEAAIHYDDLPFAEFLLTRALVVWPNDYALNNLKARLLALGGDARGAAASLRDNLSLKGVKAAESNAAFRVIAFLEGGGIKAFDKVNAPLNLTPAERLRALRQTSRTLFSFRRYEDCRLISAEVQDNMFAPEVVRIHNATYLQDAPNTAEGFVRTPMYNEWDKMETRFYPYGDAYGESGAVDERRHLKGVEQPVCDPDYPTGVRVLYNDDGVHVYIRGDDPAIDEVKLGKRFAGDLELCFRPGGDDKPYRSIFFTKLPGSDDPHMAEWASPSRTYARNTEAVFKDATLTDKGFVAHMFLPWLAFYRDLPVNGEPWRLGVIRWSGKGGYTVGGIVHELSRSMVIKFDITPAQLLALKRRVSLQAFNRYKGLRENDSKFIKMWEDPLLGDKEFFAAEVAPLLEKLDKAGEELTAPAPDSAIEKIFTEFLPLWAGIDYEIADLRTRYLNKRLFGE